MLNQIKIMNNKNITGATLKLRNAELKHNQALLEQFNQETIKYNKLVKKITATIAELKQPVIKAVKKAKPAPRRIPLGGFKMNPPDAAELDNAAREGRGWRAARIAHAEQDYNVEMDNTAREGRGWKAARIANRGR